MRDENLFQTLAPFRQVMRTHRKTHLRAPAWQLSRNVGQGYTWITEMEIGHKSSNPGLLRLTRWARAVRAQEFGLHIVLNDVYTEVDLLGMEDQ